MTRQLIIAAIVAVTSTVAVGTVDASCGGFGCHSAYGRPTGYSFYGFHARFGCSPKEAHVLFQKHPELITRFPEMARILQGEFGEFTTTATTTETVVETGDAAAVDAAVAETPADPAPATGIATDAPAAEVPAEAPPADAPATPTPAEAAEVAAPVAAPVADDAAADPNAPPADLPASVPAQPELEPLLGLWVNESDAADQPIAKIDLANDGNATVTVNTAVGPTEINKPFAIENDTFKLDGNDLAKVVSADADKVVLDANGTALTFVRP